ncbi:MAG: VWA domain-containing protein [Endomicrobiales bacterium]|nr:VWA domain-containing protein [Endomicrobiales bacterium]
MRFADPIYIILLLVFAAAAYFAEKKLARKKEAVISFSGTDGFSGINPSPRLKLRFIPKAAYYAAIALVFFAMARPQAGQKTEEIYNQGVDIMLVLDTSTSMQAIDFRPHNRFEATKKVAKEFAKQRKTDRIGIVVFAGLAFTQCPFTADIDSVLDFIDQCEIGMTEVDGTAIGSAIATASNRLKDSKGKSKVMILITDGRNNSGEIDPLTAAQAAAALDVKIYAIGAGKPGGALFPVNDPVFGRRYVKVPEQELDEDTLAKVAEATGGRYFRATDTASLERIMGQINEMEKTDVKSIKYTNYTELFSYFLWPAFILFGFGIFIGNTWLKKIP